MATTIVNGWEFTESLNENEKTIKVKFPNNFSLLLAQNVEGVKGRLGSAETDTWEVNIIGSDNKTVNQLEWRTEDEVIEIAENTAKLQKTG